MFRSAVPRLLKATARRRLSLTGSRMAAMATTSSQSASEFLTDPSLLRDLAYIGGQWTTAGNEATFPVEGRSGMMRFTSFRGGWCLQIMQLIMLLACAVTVDPATHVVIARVPAMTTKECELAIDSADQAWVHWKGRTCKVKSISFTLPDQISD